MKSTSRTSLLFVFAALFLFVARCNTPQKETAAPPAEASTLTPEQKQATEKEISELVKAFFADVEKLDIEKCMTYFENTSDFQAVNPDGTFADYHALKKLNADAFAQMTSFTLTPKKESIRVLSDSLVLYTFTTAQGAILKTGEKMSYENVAATMLFAKINGAWKATFYQESAPGPVVGK